MTTDIDCFAACVGIDWADQEHAVCLQAESGPAESATLPQTAEALGDWAAGLRRRFGGRPVAVCLELRKGALVYALMKYEFLVLFPINPAQLAYYRKSLGPSGAKDDPSDAALLLDFFQKHFDKLQAWKPDDQATRLLGQLVEDRRTAVNLRTQLVNSLKARLKQYFPQALDLVEILHSRLACKFLLKWPSLAELQRAKPSKVRAFYQAHRCRRKDVIEARLELIRQAQPLCTDAAVVESGCRWACSLAQQLLQLQQAIAEYDERLAELVAQHPDQAIFSSLPGAGSALIPRLIAAFGRDRGRFQSAQQVQNFSGIAPVTKQSGRSKTVHRRWQCPKFLRQTFHEFAGCSIPQSVWAKAYYDLQRTRGKRHHAAVRTLAYKWIRVLFRCWQNHVPYDEARYLTTLRKRHPALLAHVRPIATNPSPSV
jgi:transposase